MDFQTQTPEAQLDSEQCQRTQQLRTDVATFFRGQGGISSAWLAAIVFFPEAGLPCLGLSSEACLLARERCELSALHLMMSLAWRHVRQAMDCPPAIQRQQPCGLLAVSTQQLQSVMSAPHCCLIACCCSQHHPACCTGHLHQPAHMLVRCTAYTYQPA